jgi:vitamin B12 transporter
MLRRISHIILTFFLTLTLVPSFAWCVDSDDTMSLFEGMREQVVSTSRFPSPISKIAENVTVVTADDIARLNAHTLAEVLQTVPGIQLDHLRTPTTWTFFNIQGALNTTVLVLIDGIRQNDFDQNQAAPGLIPVQQIERIEIIKGAASATWGSALGGVINIVTKMPNPDRPISGLVSGSIGSRFTADSRAEASGTINRFGYYLTAGNIHSDGLTPNTATNLNNLYGKAVYLLPGNGTATFGLSHLTARPGMDEADTPNWGFVHDNNQFRRTSGFLKYSQPLAGNLNLDIDGYITNRDDHTKLFSSIYGSNDYVVRDSTRGANTRLTWGDGQQNLVAGVEYGHAQASSRDLLSTNPPDYDRTWESWALYANGACTIGQLTVLPGLRFDSTGVSGDNMSYTLGATYQVTETTLIRTYAAQGFSLPSPRAQNSLQKVRTIQGGVESGAIPYLWLKGTYFFNALRNSQSAGTVAITNQNRQGFEIEARTTRYRGLSLSGGYTYLYVKDVDTGERLHSNDQQSVPPHTVKLALNYDNTDLGLRGTLTGNYAWWRAIDYPVQDMGMIWDLHLGWKPLPKSELSPELFFSVHNLFNGEQTAFSVLYKNPPRWFEGGLKVRF